MSEGGEARNHEEVEAPEGLRFSERNLWDAVAPTQAEVRIVLARLARVRSSGSAAQNHEDCPICGKDFDHEGYCEVRNTEKLTTDERKGVEWAIDRGIASLRAEGFKFPAEGNEAILRSAREKLAELGSVVPADEKAGRNTNNAPKKKGNR